MEHAYHGGTILHTNVVADVRMARDAGYDAIEFWLPKLTRYLDAGFTADDLRGQLGSLKVTMLDVLLPIESRDPGTRERLLAETARMAEVAERLSCPALQVVALDEFDSDSWDEQRRILVASLNELADIAEPHGVRLALEPVTWTRFKSLDRALEVIDAVGSERLGLSVDTWHLWTAGTSWDDVATLDPDLILSVHLGDTAERSGERWCDEDRTVLPGEGILPLREAVDAILATGYDGGWAVEIKSPRHWEWDPDVLARDVLERARQLLPVDRD